MRKGWERRALGDFLSLQRRHVHIDELAVYKLVTLAVNGRGARLRKAVLGSEVGTAKYEVRSGDLMISKIDARKGANALLPSELDRAVVTGDFLSYAVDESIVTPAYLDLWVRQPEFADLCDTISGGTTNRVRMDVHRFPLLTLPIPSLEEQRRVVDLISAVDEVVAGAQLTAETAFRAYAARGSQLRSGEDAVQPLSALVAKARSGATPSRKRPELYGGEIPWVKSGEVAGEVIYSTSETITDEALGASSAWLVPAGAVLVAMYGATAAQVGRLGIPAATNQAVLALVPDEGVDGDFLYHLLRSDSERLKSLATGAAQPNLSKGVIMRQEYAIPPLDEQRKRAEEMSALLDVVHAARHTVSSLQDLRSNILIALLSGEHEIPASYDAVMEPVK